MCVIMRFPRCDVCKSWKMPWKIILLKEWEPCVRVYDIVLPTLPEQKFERFDFAH